MDKEMEKEGQITYYFLGKCVESSSGSSFPETKKPPAKSVKFAESIL